MILTDNANISARSGDQVAAVVASGPAVSGSLRPTRALTVSGQHLVVGFWLTHQPMATGQLELVLSYDGGATWTAAAPIPVDLTTDRYFSWVPVEHVVAVNNSPTAVLVELRATNLTPGSATADLEIDDLSVYDLLPCD